jgi:uncharacterized membrane protein
MRYLSKIFSFLFVAGLLLAPSFVFAEEINSFNQNIKIEKNSNTTIVETIVYDFGQLNRHGIIRYMPYKYNVDGKTVQTDVLITGVKDEEGRGYEFKTSKEGNDIYVRIGDPDSTVSGIKTYKITYTLSGVINFFEKHDELYWNVTGNGWQVPISSASVSVTLPKNISESSWKLKCFTGVSGSKESQCGSNIFSSNKVTFSTKTQLLPKQGLTIVVGWPKNIVFPLSQQQKLLNLLRRNFLIFLPLLTFLGLFFYWRKNGRDPQGRGTIIAEYEPPKGATPADAELLPKERIEIKAITATIIDLARRGFFTIKEIETKKLGVFKSKDWELERTEKLLEGEGIEVYEKDLIEGLFKGEGSVKLSALKNRTSTPKVIEEFKKSVIDRAVQNKYFPSSPTEVKAKFSGVGAVIIFLVIFIFRPSGFLNFSSIILTGILFIIFSFAMPRLTLLGKEMEEKLLGFKEFLSKTERDRVKFHFSPQANPEKFADYLPYAIVFGVEKQWAELFQGIEIPKPDWYQGAWVGGYTALAFSDSLGSFGSTFGSSLASSSSAASGGSGFGGGGFSGGGFGGGGGGSW